MIENQDEEAYKDYCELEVQGKTAAKIDNECGAYKYEATNPKYRKDYAAKNFTQFSHDTILLYWGHPRGALYEIDVQVHTLL